MELLLPESQQLIYIVEQMAWIVFRFSFSSFLCLVYTTYLPIPSSTVSYLSCSVVYFIFALYLDARGAATRSADLVILLLYIIQQKTSTLISLVISPSSFLLAFHENCAHSQNTQTDLPLGFK